MCQIKASYWPLFQFVPRTICCSRYEVNLFYSNRCAAAEPALHSAEDRSSLYAPPSN
jgi:hypothetical protein